MLSFNEMKKFVILGIVALIALIGILFASNSQGKWVCKDGVWIAKGNPTTSKPVTLCK